MKIYFAASIRGGRDDQRIYADIIKLLRVHGDVLTEHFGAAGLNSIKGTGSAVRDIYEQDMTWIREADVIVAEVTQPSLGVGYEIGRAEEMGKKILCLYRPQSERTLSAMIAGNSELTVREYKNINDIPSLLSDFFSN